MTKAEAIIYWLQPLREGAEIEDLITRGVVLGCLSPGIGMWLYHQSRGKLYPREWFVDDVA